MFILKTKIFAHRGASKMAPENTMPAFNLAYNIGADGIETDVQLTKDGIPVLIHDETLRRTSTGTGFVQDHSLEQLKELDFGSWFSPKYSDTSIVTLDEFLTWVKNKDLLINIELKNNVIDYKHLETIVYEKLQHYELINRTIISSFNPKSIKKISKLDSNLETAFLTSQRIRHLLPFSKSLGATAIHAKYRLLTNRLVYRCEQEELALRIYTVNQPSRIMKCFKLGCDGIFTDVPHLAIEYKELYLHKHKRR